MQIFLAGVCTFVDFYIYIYFIVGLFLCCMFNGNFWWIVNGVYNFGVV